MSGCRSCSRTAQEKSARGEAAVLVGRLSWHAGRGRPAIDRDLAAGYVHMQPVADHAAGAGSGL
jgi:hypothetical protein